MDGIVIEAPGSRRIARIRRLLLATSLLLVLLLRPSATASSHEARTLTAATAAQQIDTYFTRLARRDLFYGSVLVYRRGHVLLRKAYGWANLSTGRRDTPGTIYKIASLSKQFTAMAIMQLQAMHKVSIHDSVCRYIASCPPTWQPISLQNLLDMTSGLPDYIPATLQAGLDDPTLYRPTPPGQIITAEEKEPLQFTPGTRWQYNNLGYLILGQVIAAASGQSYAHFLVQHIFKPLGMTRTSVLVDGRSVPGIATGYNGHTAARQFAAEQQLGPANLYSTVADLERWDRALSTTKLVSRATLRQIFTAQWVFPPRPGDPSAFAGYGYGWFVGGKIAGQHYIYHDGTWPGFLSVNTMFPAVDVHVIILSNQFRWSDISGDVLKYVESQALRG
jgi:CubicO group peptidase (beta-lactamase class C family)